MLNSRNDVGVLWENYVIAERMKLLRYSISDAIQYFWRTTQQQEIDLIEENDGQFNAYEFKWNKDKKVRFPQTFTENYPNTKTHTVTPANIEDFLLS